MTSRRAASRSIGPRAALEGRRLLQAAQVGLEAHDPAPAVRAQRRVGPGGEPGSRPRRGSLAVLEAGRSLVGHLEGEHAGRRHGPHISSSWLLVDSAPEEVGMTRRRSFSSPRRRSRPEPRGGRHDSRSRNADREEGLGQHRRGPGGGALHPEPRGRAHGGGHQPAAAYIVSILAPDRDGKVVDVTLGLRRTSPATSATGPTSARWSAATPTASRGASSPSTGQTYTLARNNGPNRLHGGPRRLPPAGSGRRGS